MSDKTETIGRIRAVRLDDVENQLQRSRNSLGLSGEFTLDEMQPHRLARALRMARRAAGSGSKDYDPARHLLLARYLKSLKLSEFNICGKPTGISQRQSGKIPHR